MSRTLGEDGAVASALIEPTPLNPPVVMLTPWAVYWLVIKVPVGWSSKPMTVSARAAKQASEKQPARVRSDFVFMIFVPILAC